MQQKVDANKLGPLVCPSLPRAGQVSSREWGIEADANHLQTRKKGTRHGTSHEGQKHPETKLKTSSTPPLGDAKASSRRAHRQPNCPHCKRSQQQQHLNHMSMDVCHAMFLSKQSGRSPVVATAKVSRLIHVITVEKGTTAKESRPHGTGAYATANMV